MPHEQPGGVHEAVATKVVLHGDPSVEDGFAGTAAKTAEPSRYTDPATDGRRSIALTEAFEIMLSGIHSIRQALFPGGTMPDVGDRVYITSAANAVVLSDEASVHASLTTALAGANNDLIFTAREEGAVGNDIDTTYVDPAGNNAVLAVTVDPATDSISVSLATGAGGAITSTAAQIAAAIRAHGEADDLVEVANAAANNGTGIVIAMATTPLAGGADTAQTYKLGLVERVDAARDLAFVNYDQRGAF